MKDKKRLLIVGLIFIVSVIIILILLLFFNKKEMKDPDEQNINVEKLDMEFEEIFNNQGNEYVLTQYNIQEEKAGKYKIEANIPRFQGEDGTSIEINKEIGEIFINKLINIYNNSQSYTKLNIDYASSVNGNIVSLAIKCVLKEGNNAQRTIIKTYNYNIETKQKIEIISLIPEEEREDIQEKINKKVAEEIKREEAIVAQGYNVYRRQKESEIYRLENATEFYINNNILYIIYSYGNNSYTSEMDLVITKIK